MRTDPHPTAELPPHEPHQSSPVEYVVVAAPCFSHSCAMMPDEFAEYQRGTASVALAAAACALLMALGAVLF